MVPLVHVGLEVILCHSSRGDKQMEVAVWGQGEEAEGGMSIHQVMDLSLCHESPKRVWGSGQRMTRDTGKPIPDVQRLRLFIVGWTESCSGRSLALASVNHAAASYLVKSLSPRKHIHRPITTLAGRNEHLMILSARVSRSSQSLVSK